MRIHFRSVALGCLFLGLANLPAQAGEPRQKVLTLGRIANLEGCDSSGLQFTKILGRSLAETRQVLVIGFSDTSALRSRPARGGKPPQGGGMGGPPGGGGMSAPPGGGMGGMNAPEGGAVPKAPSRHMVLVELGWQVDTAAGSLETVDTTKSVLRRGVSVRLRAVDESTGRAVWKQALSPDLAKFEAGTCPQTDRIASVAAESAKAILEGVAAAASKP